VGLTCGGGLLPFRSGVRLRGPVVVGIVTTLDAPKESLRGAKAFGVLRATGVPGAGVVSEGGAAIA